jgi:hypothetical protein
LKLKVAIFHLIGKIRVTKQKENRFQNVRTILDATQEMDYPLQHL